MQVAQLPLTLKAWREDPASPDEKGAKTKSPPKDKQSPADSTAGEGPELSQLVLLGVGTDLELETTPSVSGGADGDLDGADEGGAPSAADVACQGAATEGGSGAGGSGGGADSKGGDATPPGLVHLRDGRQLDEYGLLQGSVVYLVLEGRG